MNYLFNPGTSKGNHGDAKANDMELQGCSMLPGTRGARCASAPAGDAVFLLSLHHGICPHMLVSCRHNWFIPTCLSKNYIEGKCKFTKFPAGSDAHDCGFSLQASGSHIFGFMVWNEEGKMKNCDWQVANKDMARCFSEELKIIFILKCISAVIASQLFLVLLLTEDIFSWHLVL